MKNLDIREAIKKAKFRHWQIADLLNISEATFVRKLRKELSETEKQRILKIIEDKRGE